MKTIIGIAVVALLASILSLKTDKIIEKQVCHGGPVKAVKPVRNIP